MKKEIVNIESKNVAGLMAHTNNIDFESSIETSRIGPTIERYYAEGVENSVPDLVKKGVYYSVYAAYESDENGNYDYFYGGEVSKLENISEGLNGIHIPAGKYVKLTVGPGPMPMLVMETWQQIWQMSPEELGGERAYIADFEVYDERAADPQNAVVDVFVGIK